MRKIILFAAIACGSLVALSSEGLSLFHLLRADVLRTVWLAIAVVLIAGLIWRRKLRLPGTAREGLLSSIRKAALRKENYRQWDTWMLALLVLMAALLFVVAILAPPNTNDSLGYHLSRVAHWIQDRSLQPYATPINRQIWMPPWAEMSVMQLFLLWGSDRLSNLVQWLCMLGSVMGVSLIAAELGASKSGQVFAALFCATLPMGILQATSTQTDYATAFWLVCLVYFVVAASRRKLEPVEWLFLGLAVGLGVLTKGTFEVFALPFLIWLGISTVRRTGPARTGGYLVAGVLLVVFLNAGIWIRNIQVYGFPLGSLDNIHNLANSSLTPGALVSNIIRNSTIHLGTPYGIINGPAGSAVEQALNWIGQDVNDPATTLDTYRFKRYIQEDRAGNPFHFLLIPIGLGLLLYGAKRAAAGKDDPESGFPKPGFRRWFGNSLSNPAVILGIMDLLGFVLFSAVYKWQSTGGRLMLPFFVAWAPAAGAAFQGMEIRRWRWAVSLLLLAASVQHVVSNPSRALIPLVDGAAPLLKETRMEVLFANTPENERAYLSVTRAIRASGCQKVGLVIESHEPEYPYWALLDAPGAQMTIQHVGNVSSPLDRYLDLSFKPCAIVCTTCTQKELDGLKLQKTFMGVFYLYGEEIP